MVNYNMNYHMYKLIKEGEAIDVSKYPKTPEGDYILPPELDIEGMDLCNLETEKWIWSVGKRHSDGVIIASHSSKLYQHPDYTCIWLR